MILRCIACCHISAVVALYLCERSMGFEQGILSIRYGCACQNQLPSYTLKYFILAILKILCKEGKSVV